MERKYRRRSEYGCTVRLSVVLMAQPPCVPPPRKRAATDDAEQAAAAQKRAREPLRWPQTSRRHRPVEYTSESNEDPCEDPCDSTEEGEGGRWQSEDGRVAADATATDQLHPSTSSSAAAPGCQQLERSSLPEEASAAVTAAALAQRASRMFSTASSTPSASGLPLAASKVTNELIVAASDVIKQLCTQHGKSKKKMRCYRDCVAATQCYHRPNRPVYV